DGERRRVERRDEVVPDAAGGVLVEDPELAVGLEVQLEALGLDDGLGRPVADLDGGPVRLPRDRAPAGELAAVEHDLERRLAARTALHAHPSASTVGGEPDARRG